MAITELSSSASWDRFSMMIYGLPGIGKTWLAGSSANVELLQPVLLLDNDGGSQTVRGNPKFGEMTVWRVTSFKDYNEVYARIIEDPNKFRTIIIDNIGAVHHNAMMALMALVVKKAPDRDEEVPSMREYGIVRLQVRKLLDAFIELPSNLIVTAHADLSKDEVTLQTRVRPALPGKLAYELPGLMNLVLYLDAQKAQRAAVRPAASKGGPKPNKTITRVAYCQPTGRIDAKDQSDALGEEIVDPTMQKICDAIGLA